MIYLISDTHFYHKSIIPYCKRPFSSINEMNEKIIENWNSIVTNKDKQCHISKFNMLGTSCLVFKCDGYAGESNIGKAELKKIIKKLSSLKTTD